MWTKLRIVHDDFTLKHSLIVFECDGRHFLLNKMSFCGKKKDCLCSVGTVDVAGVWGLVGLVGIVRRVVRGEPIGANLQTDCYFGQQRFKKWKW